MIFMGMQAPIIWLYSPYHIASKTQLYGTGDAMVTPCIIPPIDSCIWDSSEFQNHVTHVSCHITHVSFVHEMIMSWVFAIE